MREEHKVLQKNAMKLLNAFQSPLIYMYKYHKLVYIDLSADLALVLRAAEWRDVGEDED